MSGPPGGLLSRISWTPPPGAPDYVVMALHRMRAQSWLGGAVLAIFSFVLSTPFNVILWSSQRFEAWPVLVIVGLFLLAVATFRHMVNRKEAAIADLLHRRGRAVAVIALEPQGLNGPFNRAPHYNVVLAEATSGNPRFQIKNATYDAASLAGVIGHRSVATYGTAADPLAIVIDPETSVTIWGRPMPIDAAAMHVEVPSGTPAPTTVSLGDSFVLGAGPSSGAAPGSAPALAGPQSGPEGPGYALPRSGPHAALLPFVQAPLSGGQALAGFRRVIWKRDAVIVAAALLIFVPGMVAGISGKVHSGPPAALWHVGADTTG